MASGIGTARATGRWPIELTPSPWSRRVGIAVGGLFLAVFAGAWWRAGAPTSWPKLADDAFYYFQVAENVANGHLLSVDKLHFTNGFQPLWMLLLMAFYALHPEPLVVAPACIAVVQIGLLALSVALLVDLAERFAGRVPAILAAILLLFPRFVNVALGGLEGGLVLLLMVLTLRRLALSPSWLELQPRWRDARTGVWLGLLMLARLDAVWLLLAVAGAVTLRGLKADDLALSRRLARIAAKGLALFWPVLLLVLPYLAWNQAMTGHLVPISGILKSTFPHPQWNGRYFAEHKEYYALILLTCLATLRLRDAPVPVRWTLSVAAAGVLVHALYTLLFMHWAVFGWHYAMAIATGPLALAWLLRPLPVKVQKPAIALAALAMAGLFAFSLVKRETSFVPWTLAGGNWARAHLPPDAILAMKDSGAFTYQSQRRVVNLDGVINGFPYQEALCRGELGDFLQRAGVQYVVQHAVPLGAADRDFVQAYPCHLPAGRPSSLTLRAADVVFRGEAYGADGDDQVVIWRSPWPPIAPGVAPAKPIAD